jgi:hypothetical protein
MYRVDPLPSRQSERDALFRRRLRFLFGSALAVAIVPLTILLLLWWRGERPADETTIARILGPDGTTELGAALVVSPEYALTAVNVPAGAHVSVDAAAPLPSRVMRSEALTSSTTLTLLKLASSVSRFPDLGTAQPGVAVYAVSPGGRWEGTLQPASSGVLYEPLPAWNGSSGSGVFAAEGASLVGIGVQTAGGQMQVMSMREILAKFPDIQSGR